MVYCVFDAPLLQLWKSDVCQCSAVVHGQKVEKSDRRPHRLFRWVYIASDLPKARSRGSFGAGESQPMSAWSVPPHQKGLRTMGPRKLRRMPRTTERLLATACATCWSCCIWADIHPRGRRTPLSRRVRRQFPGSAQQRVELVALRSGRSISIGSNG